VVSEEGGAVPPKVLGSGKLGIAGMQSGRDLHETSVPGSNGHPHSRAECEPAAHH